MLSKTLIEEQINNRRIFGIVIENESCNLRFPYISEDEAVVRDLLCAIPDDVSVDHIRDIIKDFIIGKAYDSLILNDLA